MYFLNKVFWWFIYIYIYFDLPLQDHEACNIISFLESICTERHRSYWLVGTVQQWIKSNGTSMGYLWKPGKICLEFKSEIYFSFPRAFSQLCKKKQLILFVHMCTGEVRWLRGLSDVLPPGTTRVVGSIPVMLRLHTAINRADFVSWCMWFNGSRTEVQRHFLTNAFCFLRAYITCTKIRNRPD